MFIFWYRVRKLTSCRILGKSSQSDLDELIAGLSRDPKKMAVLRLLDEQMDLLMDTGKTNLALFDSGLKTGDLSSKVPSAYLQDPDLHNNIYAQVQIRIQGDHLAVKGTGFQFSVDGLKTLGDGKWLNSGIVTASLDVSDKLPFVRVGSYIPTQSQEGPYLGHSRERRSK